MDPIGRRGSGRRVRVVYEKWRGKIADGLQLDHLCRLRRCVNPNHLEPVIPKVNLSRSSAISTRNSLKTHSTWNTGLRRRTHTDGAMREGGVSAGECHFGSIKTR